MGVEVLECAGGWVYQCAEIGDWQAYLHTSMLLTMSFGLQRRDRLIAIA